MTRAEARIALRKTTGCSYAFTHEVIPEPAEPTHAMLAAMAMQGILASGAHDVHFCVQHSRMIADAMIEERMRREQGEVR